MIEGSNHAFILREPLVWQMESQPNVMGNASAPAVLNQALVGAESEAPLAEEAMDRKPVALFGGAAAVISSLCCLTPVVLVLLGLSSVSAAAALGNQLYFGPARWALYGVSLLFLMVAVGAYYYNRGVCTLEAAKRHRNQILNTFLVVFVVGLVGYLVFTYVVLELIGQALGIWD